MEASVISLPEDMETPLSPSPEDTETLLNVPPTYAKSLVSPPPENKETPLNPSPEDTESPVNVLPEDSESPVSPPPEDMETPISPLSEDTESPVSLPPETTETFANLSPEDIETSVPILLPTADMETPFNSLPDNITMDERFLSFAQRVAENTESSARPSLISSTIDNILSDIRRVHRILSYEDTMRLMRLQAVYENVGNQGKVLASRGENNQFFLVDTINNGFVPKEALFPAPYSNHLNRIAFKPLESEKESLRGELSASLSNYIWQSDLNCIHVQIRSRVNCYHRFCENMKVVFSRNGAGDNGEYCLASCSCCGGIKWLPRSHCRSGNHIWTLHLFDPPSEGEEVHLSQGLRRRTFVNPSVNVTNNIGRNINQSSGHQVVGDVDCRTEIKFLPRV